MTPLQISLPPGFRFHPTDIELVWYYLKRKITGKPFRIEAISVVELYKFAPWDLPDKSCLRSKDLVWYFFCPRDKKYSHGSRTNRTTETGFWKTTGKDRCIVYNSQTVGMKKTLIFHLGKAPQGSRTNWVMYEFRLESKDLANAGFQQDAFVLCKIFEKSGAGPKTGEQYGAPFKEEDWEDDAEMLCPIPLQFAAAELGEPSSMVGNFEVGEPSRVRELPYADGLSLEQLNEILNSSPTRSNTSYDKFVDAGILLDDIIVEPDLDFENIYGDLDDLCILPFQEDYMQISDMGLTAPAVSFDQVPQTSESRKTREG